MLADELNKKFSIFNVWLVVLRCMVAENHSKQKSNILSFLIHFYYFIGYRSAFIHMTFIAFTIIFIICLDTHIFKGLQILE
jgi:hypothetical protein